MKLQKKVSLKNYTTFKIGGQAAYFLTVNTKAELVEAIQEAKKRRLPFFVLAGGSNLLISDKCYRGMVIQIKSQKLKVKNNSIITESGALLGQVVNLSAKNSLTGLEWAAGIPGTVGGAITGNAGAFDGSMKDSVSLVEFFDAKRSKFKKLKNKECKFGYRTSIFKKTPNLIIVSCEIKLKHGNKQKIKEKIQKHLDYRDVRHPKEPSAGSIFRNVNVKTLKPSFFKKFPETKGVIKENTLPTAFLIDQCGLKGKKMGKAQVSELHPNFLINIGGAKAEDVLKLIKFIKGRVKQKFGIKLKEETDFLGF